MLFYPSHDIALAFGVRHFNPPAMAIRLQEDLAHLSSVWNGDFERQLSPVPIPWGWDYDTRQYIHRHYGIKLSQLPTDDELALIRQLSSRQTTIRLYQELAAVLSGPFVSTNPVCLTTDTEVFEYIRERDARQLPFVLKTPWSSSGRGLALSQHLGRDGQWHYVARETLLAHARTTLRRMGAIMAEDWLDGKRQDFAMLFEAKADRVRFIGYSLFDNDPATQGTTYRRGYLLSNADIETRLEVDSTMLREVATAYEGILTRLLAPLLGKAWPLGYMGIDMMTMEAGLVPCVEMNLRCTMGTVCRLWHDQHGEDGFFSISPMQRDGHFIAQFETATALL